MNDRQQIMWLLGRKLGIYLAATAVAYVLASVFATQSVVTSLTGMGIETSASTRLAMTLHDLAGMAGMFLPLIAFGFLLAFLVTALLFYLLKRWQFALYTLAGATALVAIHVALNLSFDITLVAAARTPIGLLLQAVAGAAGGFTYAALTRRLINRPLIESVEIPT
jgi:hypothetical protein